MGSVGSASIFANGCRHFSIPVALMRTITHTHVSLREQFHCKKLFQVAASPKKRTFVFQSTKPDLINTNAVSSLNGNPVYDSLLPCPLHNVPPRIEHLVVTDGGRVLEFISKALDLSALYVADLIHFGAVHYALVCPQPPPTATPEQVSLFKKFTEPSVLENRASIKGKTVREAQKTFRITHGDQFVEVGTYLRVYVHPKRFPRCYEIDWKSRIIAVTESYVVLDKPAGTSQPLVLVATQHAVLDKGLKRCNLHKILGGSDFLYLKVGGTTDNIEESCATFATRALGLAEPLKTTHRIDNCTEGCVVLAKTKEFCSLFHKKIREKRVKKLYLALAVAPLPIGVITHYMRPINRAPRLISEDFIEGWCPCKLEILDCKMVQWSNVATEKKYCIEDCQWPSKDHAYECKINILTGRTHQSRAQLAACGAPLVGDSMYMPAVLAEMNTPGMNPFGKCRKHYTNEDEKEMAITEWIALHGKEPSVSIGLQACQISWDDDEHIYEAGSPWWR